MSSEANEHREQCWSRFLSSVDAVLERDDREPGRRLIESVRERFGDEAANRQRAELNNFIVAQRKKRASHRN